MFGNFKRRKEQEVQQELNSLQQQEAQFDALMADHRVQFDKAMESQKKASDLIIAVYAFLVAPVTPQNGSQQYERLVSLIDEVRKDELLKRESKVQELVEEIYQNLNDKGALSKLTPRLNDLVGVPKTPELPINIHFTI